MKRFFIAAVAFVLTAGFVGCSKVEEFPIVDGSNDVRVEFSVAEMDGFDSTRAVKSGWEAGDQIFVFFSANGSWLLADDSKANSVTLTYDGSEWSAYANGVDENLLSSASGTFFAIHYPGVLNHLTEASWPAGRYLFDGYEGGEILTVVGTYTIADNVITLPTLSLKMNASAVQFSVKNLASLGGNWQLLVNKDRVKADGYSAADAATPFIPFNATNIMLYPTSSTHAMVAMINEYWAEGVAYKGDVSFYGEFDSQNGQVTTNYLFVLKNVESSKVYYFNYAPTPFERLAGKSAYLLPELTLNGDGTPAEGCLWE
jgi:hypothetical protein